MNSGRTLWWLCPSFHHRFVSNGQTVGDGHKIEDLPTSGAADGVFGSPSHESYENDEDDTSDRLGCGSVLRRA